MAEQIVEKPQDTDDKPTAPGPSGLVDGMNRATETILASMGGAGIAGARTAADYFLDDGSGRLKEGYHDGTTGPGAIGWNRHAVQFVARNQVERVMAAVGTWESGGGVVGKIDFGAVGPSCRNGDHAYGAWQVMGRNIDAWGQEAGLGHVTLAQFMEKGADGQITARAQQLQHDIVFHQFEKHLKAGYAPEDAASIWFTGQPRRAGYNPNDGGTDANTYVSKFSRAYAHISVDPNAASMVAAATPDRNGDVAANTTSGASTGSSTMAFLGSAAHRLKALVVGEAHAEPVQTTDAAPAGRRTFDKGAMTTADTSPTAHKPATPGKTPAAPTVTT